MGKLGGFLQIERHGIPQRDPRERAHDYKEFLLTRPTGELREQGARCMDCGVPFCHNGCPLGNLIPDWNDLVYEDRFEDAIVELHATNNFPEFTGRLCPAPCEAACVLEIREGDAVTIKQIEHAIIGRAWEEGWVTPQPAAARDRAGGRGGRLGTRRNGRRAAAAPRGPSRDVVRARRGRGRAGALRGAGLQDREDGRAAPRRAADRRGCRAALRRGGRPRRRPSRSCGEASTRSYWRRARACRAICRCRAASSTGCTSRWTTSTSATAGSHASSVRSRASPSPLPSAQITAKDKDVVVIGGGDTGADCVGNALREGARSIVQLELLPEPPPKRPDDRTPWPQWPQKYRLSYAMEEAKTARPRRAGLLDRDRSASRTTAAAPSRRCGSPRPRPSRRSRRWRAPRRSCRRSSCCSRWASWAPEHGAARAARRGAGPARKREGGQALHDVRRRRVRRRRRPPRTVVDRVGDQRGPSVRADGRSLPGGEAQRRRRRRSNCPRTMARRVTKTRTQVPRARRSTSGRASKRGSCSGVHGLLD